MSAATGSRPPGEALPAPSLKALRAIADDRVLATDADPPRAGRRRRPARDRVARRVARVRLVGRLRRRTRGSRRDPGRSRPDEPGPPGPRGLPDLPAGRARVRRPPRPGDRPVRDRQRRDRQRCRAQRPGAVAEVPAPRLPPEPVRRGLLVPLPVPSIALRPAGDQGGRGALRSGSPGHGPVRRRGRCGRRPDDRHRGGHARAAPRRAR